MQPDIKVKKVIAPALIAAFCLCGMPVMAHHSGLDRLVSSAASTPVVAPKEDASVKEAVRELLKHNHNHSTTAKPGKKERSFKSARRSTDKILILGGAEAFPM